MVIISLTHTVWWSQCEPTICWIYYNIYLFIENVSNIYLFISNYVEVDTSS